MRASLVFDGGDNLRIPESMGVPTLGQMKGTLFDQLTEAACRICYDSLGFDVETGKPRGRTSEKLHQHILEVQHHSVLEHANFTVVIPVWNVQDAYTALLSLLNRKGIWVHSRERYIEITTNLRAVVEWDRHTPDQSDAPIFVRDTLQYFGHILAPQVIKDAGKMPRVGSHLKQEMLTDDQAWITLWLYGSRGFTHEQVRHRFAMSQRSTRYVDEDGSPYIAHPLVTDYLQETSDDIRVVRDAISESVAADRKTYSLVADRLQNYLLQAGVDKLTARKQARGAARGYLGNALASEMLFSAPVSGWKWMIRQRASAAADAEIREVYQDVVRSLLGCRYGDRFSDLVLVPSPDGLGLVVSESR